jgi:sulfatase maturation enzyme AslB (radical SAM superfamily)
MSETTAPASAPPSPAASAPEAPQARLTALDTLWLQVGGTLCNLACTHCFVSCSPSNHTHERMTLAQVERYLAEAEAMGVREYYFTGGEPFLNPELEAMLSAALRRGPATVLTNGLFFDAARCLRLAALARASEYSLDLRVSLDGLDAERNDAIRGRGTYDRVLAGIRRLVAAGLEPVLTVSEVDPETASPAAREAFLALLRSLGVRRPRLKVLPLFQIGAERARRGGYEDWQRLAASDGAEGFEHLQCTSCRAVTDRGVWVCPILVNEPQARMGERLADALGAFALTHAACWTCHVYGVSCRT